MSKVSFFRADGGGAALLAGVVLFSTIEVVAKPMGATVSPAEMVCVRFVCAGALLLALAGPGWRRRACPLTARDYGWFALNGAVGVALAIGLYHWAIGLFAKASSCAVVFSANPVFVVVFARFINREPWQPRKWGALGLGLAGAACFAWERGAFDAGSLRAWAVMTLAAALFALSLCLSRRLIGRYGALLWMGFSALFGGLWVLPWALADLARDGGVGLLQAWDRVLYIAVAGTALAYALYCYGLSRATAFQSAMTFFVKPVLASLLAWGVLHERLNLPMLIGSGLILAGLACVVWGPRTAVAPEIMD